MYIIESGFVGTSLVKEECVDWRCGELETRLNVDIVQNLVHEMCCTDDGNIVC